MNHVKPNSQNQPVILPNRAGKDKTAIPRPTFYGLAIGLIVTVGLLITIAVGGAGHIHGYLEAMDGLVAKVLTIGTPIVGIMQLILLACLYSIDKREIERREQRDRGSLMNSNSIDDSDSFSASGEELDHIEADLSGSPIISDLPEINRVQQTNSTSTSSTNSNNNQERVEEI